MDENSEYENPAIQYNAMHVLCAGGSYYSLAFGVFVGDVEQRYVLCKL